MVLTVAGETLSGRVCPGLAKCVYLNDSTLRELITHEPSAVPICSLLSLPAPVVGADVWPIESETTSRFD